MSQDQSDLHTATCILDKCKVIMRKQDQQVTSEYVWEVKLPVGKRTIQTWIHLDEQFKPPHASLKEQADKAFQKKQRESKILYNKLKTVMGAAQADNTFARRSSGSWDVTITSLGLEVHVLVNLAKVDQSGRARRPLRVWLTSEGRQRLDTLYEQFHTQKLRPLVSKKRLLSYDTTLDSQLKSLKLTDK